MDSLIQDIRFAIRLMGKHPWFTVVAVVTLALGIGANTAIFSVVNAVLLKPLPYADSDRLMTFRANQSDPDLEDIRSLNRAFEAVGGVASQGLDLTGQAEPRRVQAALITSDLIDALGARVTLGRTLTPDEYDYGASRVVLLDYGFWQTTFGGDPSIVSNTIELSGEIYTVAGILERGFRLPQQTADVYAPYRVVYPVAARVRGAHILRTYVKVRPEISNVQAAEDMTRINQQLELIDPAENKGRAQSEFHQLVPLHERIAGDTRPTLLILFGVVGLVLLIACSNYANLLLARTSTRQHELVVRTALGAGRMRLVRQMLTESVLLALVGGGLGLALAVWGVDLLLVIGPDSIPEVVSVELDSRTLLFTLGVAVSTGVLFGVVPELAGARSRILDALKAGDTRVGAGDGRNKLRNSFVVAEVALSLMLLVGAGLLVRSLWELNSVDPGFEADDITTMRLELPQSRYTEIPDQTRFRTNLLEVLNSSPGIEASMISEVPLSGDWLDHNFLIDGWPAIEPGDEPSLMSRSVSGDYFSLMSIPLRDGRLLTADDDADAPLVGVVNEAMVRTYFAGKDPMGARLRWARLEGEPRWITIVGVVGDIHHLGLDRPEAPAVYTPYEQSLQPWKRWMFLVVRSPLAVADVEKQVKAGVWTLDSQLPITETRTLDGIRSQSISSARFNTSLMLLFGAVALALTGIGIYGVVAFTVSQRTREIGIRMALGAQPKDVLLQVLRRGIGLTLAGTAIGMAGAYGLSSLLSSLLFGVSRTDPATFVSISLIVVVVGLVACLVPARRAARVDPLEALRYE